MHSPFRSLRALPPRSESFVILSVKPMEDVWLVREAESSTGEVYDRPEDALARALHLLRRRGGGRLRILARNGFVERELALRAAR